MSSFQCFSVSFLLLLKSSLVSGFEIPTSATQFSKGTSDLKQNETQENRPISGSVYHAVAPGEKKFQSCLFLEIDRYRILT